MIAERPRSQRSPYRLPDGMWRATQARVRAEFNEMPCISVTPEQAGALFGVKQPVIDWILQHLAADGFLTRTAQGEYVRRQHIP